MDAELNPASGAGFELLALREWVKLLRHFELGEGFSFIILLASNRSLARRCLVELDLWLRIRRRQTVFVLPIKTPDDLANLPEQLLTIAVPQGPIWVDGTGAREVYEEAWTRCALKLNRARDGIASRFSTPLILVGAPWVREILRDTAPDFWSVRAFIADVSLPTTPQVLEQGRPAPKEDEPDFGFDPDLALRAVADVRGKPGRERQLSALLTRAGRGLFRRGRSQEALTLLLEAVDLDETAERSEPGRVDYLRDLATSYDNIGDAERALGDGEAARRAYEKALRIGERLVEQEPGRADYLRDLALYYDKMGDLQRDLGEGETARAFYEKALRIGERLVAQEPGRADYLRDLSVSYRKMGDLQRDLGEGETARAFYEKALGIGERLVAQEPGRADYLRDLSVYYNQMGDLQRALGEGETAREFYEKALEIAERLVAQEPGRADYQGDLSVSYGKMGDLQRDLGEGNGAGVL